MYNTREYVYTYISTQTTTVITQPGTRTNLGGICVNTSAAGTITVKDGATTIAILKASIGEGTYLTDMVISSGLSIVTGAASDITVKWTRG